MIPNLWHFLTNLARVCWFLKIALNSFLFFDQLNVSMWLHSSVPVWICCHVWFLFSFGYSYRETWNQRTGEASRGFAAFVFFFCKESWHSAMDTSTHNDKQDDALKTVLSSHTCTALHGRLALNLKHEACRYRHTVTCMYARNWSVQDTRHPAVQMWFSSWENSLLLFLIGGRKEDKRSK